MTAFDGGEAERRQLTLMYVDLVGSTRLSTELDPEELRDLIERYRLCAVAAVERYNGVVARFAGDGVFAYFGFPRTHEHDAEDAVRAALELVDALRELSVDGRPMAARVGIATGMVVVGQIQADATGHEFGVFGETPNLVARLQEAAPPGKVVICATTARLIGGHFECREPELRFLKGFQIPVAVTVVERAAPALGRFEAQRSTRPMQGRTAEITFLLRRWRSTVEGEARAVLLKGEPGIGKSRAVLALCEAIRDEPQVTLQFHGSPHYVNSVLFPFAAHLERAARLYRNDGAADREAKLRRLLAPKTADEEHGFAVLAQLLGIPCPAAQELPTWSPPRQRAKTFEALLRYIDQRSGERPVLLLVEDAHWMDPTSLELLTLIIERAQWRRLMVIVTARSEFEPPWRDHAHVSPLTLTRLSKADQLAMVRQVAGKALPPDVEREIVERTDGVPLFVEELTKTVLESGVLVEADGRYVLDRPLAEVGIPETLQASLYARLDRLDAGREVAQIAAALGREFSHELLEAVASVPADRLQAALDELVAAELVLRRGNSADAIYAFKHALIREAAYAGLLKTKRRALHGAIAMALRERFPAIIDHEPETVAYHLSEAGDAAAAVGPWLRAGRNAVARSANLEAVANLRHGLEALETIAAGRKRDRCELDYRFALGPCLIATQGPASADAIENFEAARVLCERLGSPPETSQVMFWIATASVIRGELVRADEAVVKLLDVADSTGAERPALLNALRGRAMILLFMGRLAEAKAATERFIALFDASSAEEQFAARAAGQDARAAGLALLSWTLWLLGDENGAAKALREARERAKAIRHPHTQAYVAYYGAVLYGLEGNTRQAQRYAERCLALSVDNGFEQWARLSRAVRGICRLRLEPRASLDHLADVMEAIGAYQRAGHQLGVTALYAMLCPALLAAGKPAKAATLVDDGLAISARGGERIFAAELHRIKAAILRTTGFESEADVIGRLLRQATAIARGQKAHALELRCVRDLEACRFAKPPADA